MNMTSVLNLNTKAIHLMREGLYTEAITLHHQALKELRSSVERDQHAEGPKNCTSEGKQQTFIPMQTICLSGYLSLFKSSFYQDHHAFSLFSQALTIDPVDLEAVPSVEGQNCLSVVILYNMGLAHQLQGMRDLNKQKTRFKSAMSLYKMAASILTKGSSDTGEQVNGLLSLAVSNNMGHLYSHFCEEQEVQDCLQWICAILELDQLNYQDLVGDDFNLFHMNVFLLHRQDAVAAAAA
jgi:tetratricopeptide (TPR) repeat protein